MSIKKDSPGKFLRKQAYRMARASHTPISYFLDEPIHSFFHWIVCANEIEAEDEAAAKKNK